MEHYHQIIPETVVDRSRDILRALGQLVLPNIHWDTYLVEKPVTEPEMSPEEALVVADNLHDQGLYEEAHLMYERYIYGD